MTTHFVRLLLPALLAALSNSPAGASPTGASVNENVQQVIFVNASAPAGGDGSAASPFQSISAGVAEAAQRNAAGTSVKVTIATGTYRETVYLDAQGNSQTLVIEGTEPGKVILTGADPLSGWTPVSGSSLYEASWPFDAPLFGSNPWVPGASGNPSDHGYIAPAGQRREILFADDLRMEQVFAYADLVPGSFYVDFPNGSGRVTAYPPSGMDFSSAAIEASTRPYGVKNWPATAEEGLFHIRNKKNLVIRNLVVQRSNGGPSFDGFRIRGCDNVLVERCIARDNNWDGFDMVGDSSSKILAQDITFRQNEAHSNGGAGFNGAWMENAIYEDFLTADNNWRGEMGEFFHWATGGIKHLFNKNVVYRRVQSIGNRTRGLWLDTSNTNITIEDCDLMDSLTHGLVLEATPGPVLVKNNLILNRDGYSPYASGGSGGYIESFTVKVNDSENITFEDNTLLAWPSVEKNHIIWIDGAPAGRTYDVLGSPGTTDVARVRNLTFTDNLFSVLGGNSRAFFIMSPYARDTLIDTNTLTSTDNRYYKDTGRSFFITAANIGNGAPLQDYGKLSLSEWQNATGDDLNSVHTNGTSAVFPGETTALLKIWHNLPGTSLSGLTALAGFPSQPHEILLPARLEVPPAPREKCGHLLQAELYPTATGNHTFWISGDDDAELWLNHNGTDPAGAQRIAFTNGATSFRDFDTRAAQQSASFSLTKDQPVYIEVVHKQGSGTGHVSVAWSGPSTSGARKIVRGIHLSAVNTSTSAASKTSGTSEQTLTLRQGVDSYAGVVDTYIREGFFSGTNYAASDSIEAATNSIRYGLVKFSDLIGNGPNQVPVGSVITSATLTLESKSGGGSIEVYRALQSWDSGSTWANSFGGNGIAFDDSEAASVTDDSGMLGSTLTLDVTDTLTEWAGGSANNGWVLYKGGNVGAVYSSEASSLSLRPQLTVQFIPPTGQTVVLFQQDLGGYSGTLDTYIRDGSFAGNSYGGSGSLEVATNSVRQSLVRFSGIFGTGPGQLSTGVSIAKAELKLTGTSGGGTVEVSRLLTSWSEFITWQSSFSGDGIQKDNAEAAASLTASGTLSTSTPLVLDVTADVVDWQNGQANHGWVMEKSGNVGRMASSENGTQDIRPVLEITLQ